MNSKMFSQAMSELDSRYVDEAVNYKKAKKMVWMKSGAIAACLAVIVVMAGIFAISDGSMEVSAHARGTEEEITTAGAVLNSGTISDTGEMKGPPLMFYLSGRDIVSVRFSCKNQQINFMDWTEKREEYGNAQNFTVAYGEDESEYYYLTINWVPNTLTRELTDNRDSRIETLPDEMRHDMIVMEITFENGKTATKAITISLLDDGRFFADFADYEITEADTFVNRPDSEAIPREILYAQGDSPQTPDDGTEETVAGIFDALNRLDYQPYTCDGLPEYELTSDDGTVYSINVSGKWVWRAKNEQAELPDEIISWLQALEDAARAYYKNTVFEVVSLEFVRETENEVTFSVCVSRGGVIQEPDRRITLQLNNGVWEVVNEGY